MSYFIVTAYRWGDKERHSYVVGMTNTKALAVQYAEDEEDFRGGKYRCEVIEIPLNEVMEDRHIIVRSITKDEYIN